ncbi:MULTISPECIES: transaldolase family protein [unclassified Coleofasciculus]|uniref:transaldolase family protein n=1 Tax=unclassified Coleofasciculus TaxID=2692782 RepID=UPI0018825E56|nr:MULTISPECIES: transaldolase family protein [unclassified Coleofasciculus]MBE9125627.1 transaldolase [Coleofasciculus sp. LEGE 07081]MBE9147341.1 transaldolase [Coleofasciculus sp. LEGE 07092]
MIQRDRTTLSASSPPKIRLFLDTADITQWQTWLPTSLFYGVTTNPLLLERAQVTCSVEQLKELARQAFKLGAKEVQLQTWGTSVDALVSTGKLLAAISDRIVVKVPVTQLGTEAASRLISQGIRITLTGVYAIHQVLIAAALGADYAAPYLGRISDLGRNGREDLVAMQRAMTGVDSTTRILVASIRSVDDIAFLTTQGLNTFTFSPAIASAFFEVTATKQAATDFEEAARRMGG